MKKSLKFIIIIWAVTLLLPHVINWNSILILGTRMNDVAFWIMTTIALVVAIIVSLVVAFDNEYTNDRSRYL